MIKRFRFWRRRPSAAPRRAPFWEHGDWAELAFFGTLLAVGICVLAAIGLLQLANVSVPLSEPGGGFWLVVIVFASLIVLGLHGIVVTWLRSRASPERRSVLARQTEWLQQGPEALDGQPQDGIISPEALDSSPGVELAHRLPSSSSETWGLILAASLAVVWNAAVVVLLRELWHDRSGQNILWIAAPFLAISLWSIGFLLRQVAFQWRCGPTHVEVAEHPLMLGQTCRAHVAQLGMMRLRRLAVYLLCEERTTFRSGTDIRHDRRCVEARCLLDRKELVVTRAKSLGEFFDLAIPHAAMHSFQTAHNAVCWEIVVRLEPHGRSVVERRFPLVVQPAVPEREVKHHGTAHQHPTAR